MEENRFGIRENMKKILIHKCIHTERIFVEVNELLSYVARQPAKVSPKSVKGELLSVLLEETVVLSNFLKQFRTIFETKHICF